MGGGGGGGGGCDPAAVPAVHVLRFLRWSADLPVVQQRPQNRRDSTGAVLGEVAVPGFGAFVSGPQLRFFWGFFVTVEKTVDAATGHRRGRSGAVLGQGC